MKRMFELATTRSIHALRQTVQGLLLTLLTLVTLTAMAETRITYYHNDLLGSTTAATDQNGEILWQRAYYPFGEKRKNPAESSEDRQAYTGKLHNDDTGLTYMNARYYDPVVGRFAAMDPVGPLDGGVQHINRYSYVYNNPYRYTDPSGMYGLAGNRGNAPEGFDPEHDAIAKGSIKELKDAKGNRIPGDEYRRHLQWNNLAIKKDPFLIAAALLPGLSLISLEGKVITSAPAEVQLFRNLAPQDAVLSPNFFSASQIQKVGYTGRVNYVVTEQGALVTGKTPHTSLSGGVPVQAAGEAKFVNGEIRNINNASGHYKPSGPAASSAAEAAFSRAGFDAAGKYKEKVF